MDFFLVCSMLTSHYVYNGICLCKMLLTSMKVQVRKRRAEDEKALDVKHVFEMQVCIRLKALLYDCTVSACT